MFQDTRQAVNFVNSGRLVTCCLILERSVNLSILYNQQYGILLVEEHYFECRGEAFR
jgi:hypothetical protein